MADKVGMTRYNASPKFFGKGRTKFDLSHSILTTGNTGDLIPILCEPIVPGSTFSLKTASLTRLETSLHQTMDNAYVEFAYFFVPSRCLWVNFDKYQGFNKDAWAQTQEYTKPQLHLCASADDAPVFDRTVTPDSLLNHLALPAAEFQGVDLENLDYGNYQALYDNSIDLLPLRGVFKIYNDYFRDTNIDSEIYYDDGDTDSFINTTYTFNGQSFKPWKENLKVNRFKDTFSTAHWQPQKGDPVSIKLDLADSAPVGGYATIANTLAAGNDVDLKAGTFSVGDFVAAQGLAANSVGVGDLVADLSNAGSGLEFTINDLRIAIALQAMRERDSRSGNRLNEKLFGTWHLEVNSLELDRAEFLGGKRIPVNMMEVLQTSETGTTVLGSDAGHSKTFDADDSFVRTFTQWGYVIGFVFVRTSRSYTQGIERKFFAKDILSEYDPMLDNIGEMPVYKKELNAVYDLTYNNMDDQNAPFGYQEAWYWYKERMNRFSGYFQNFISGTLSSWHYGDEYIVAIQNGGQTELHSSKPTLNYDWLKEGKENVERTLSIQMAPFQWSFNIHFDMSNTFEASKYSIPNTFGF